MYALYRRVRDGIMICAVSFACCSCSPSATGPAPPPYAASSGSESEPASTDGAADTVPPAGDLKSGDLKSGDPITPDSGQLVGDVGETGAATRGDVFSQIMPPESARGVATPFTIEGAEKEDPKTATLTELRADLTPKELLDFLSAADSDMQLIVTGRSGIEDAKQARRTLLHIVKMKLEASRRLVSHAETDDRGRAEGVRGELQSLSHMAALGDVKAAEELEELAETRLQSDDPQIVNDSRLVLIGFAIESLQSGDEEAPERIVRYIDQIASSSTPPDVASMMVMGEARSLLERYGHDQQARAVRDQIIHLFAGSTEPQVAQMAAKLAGSVRFDGIDKLLQQTLAGGTVEVAQWVAAGETLIDESADLQTVQYLGGAALELEGCGQAGLADATYELLARRFTEPNAATTQEVAMAAAAYGARKKVIGELFSPDLNSVDGSKLDLKDYRGKVVLIPFWAMNFPQSLQVLPQLVEIANQYPDQVAIVGVNLDPAGAPVGEFLRGQKFSFPNFQASEMTGPIAERFGIVSMPFTAIVAKDGRVAELDFTGKKLNAAVDGLVTP